MDHTRHCCKLPRQRPLTRGAKGLTPSSLAPKLNVSCRREIMRTIISLLFLLPALAFSQSIYSCKADDGSLTFQDKPCISGSEELLKKAIKRPAGNHSIWLEPNFVDTQYTIHFESKSVKKRSLDDPIYQHIPVEWRAFDVKAKVIDVYKGNLQVAEEIDLLIYVSYISSNPIELIKENFIASFCKSRQGVFYTYRDYLIQRPSQDNLSLLEFISASGTDHEGSGDCDGNYPLLNPDGHN